MSLLTVHFVVGFLVFLPYTHSLECGNTFCFPDDNEEAYCCGVLDGRHCCYYTNVARLWWFWLVLILSFVFLCICITSLCCRSRRRRRLGYIVVPGQTVAPTVIHSHVTHANVGTTPHPQYYSPGYPVHPGYDPSAPPYSYPPPYAQPPQYEGY